MNILKIKIKNNKTLFNLLLWLKLMLYYIYYLIFLNLFRLFKIDNKKILVMNYNGKGYGDNGKYICKELNNYNYKIYWATRKPYKQSLPNKINYIRYDSLKFLYHLATSKIWINNCRFRYGIKKRKNQFYIQTWHGYIGYKKSEKAVEDLLSKQYVLSAKNDSKMADLFISNSDFCTNNYKKFYWYDGEIIKCGCPRNDIIINNDAKIIDKVKKQYNIDNKTKICLYAPTFRNSGDLSMYNIDFNKLIKSLEKRFGTKWKIMIRLHPNISSLSDKLLISENVVDATNYPDMQELLVSADFMITDYSSCIFDYAISYKPGIIYASDIDDYIKERDFIIKIEDTPFSITKNNRELNKEIINFNMTDYKNNIRDFYDNIGLYEPGNSSKKIVDIISKQINERK